MSDYAQWQGKDLVLECYVQPKASRDELVGRHAGKLKIRVTAPPTDGKANNHLIRFLADTFGVPKNQVNVGAGTASRHKRLRITAPTHIPALLQDCVD